ncbi:MAG: aminotransferase class I/II-fold pyridoxal phosphate-dependent enzyme [Alcanivoracaceae bacterium]|nr:aminotransferase class I/II-fold pyridoxal phosphate-dependent enzyme [Alcanivoracaceae bacterium]
MITQSINNFITQCQQSSSAAYQQFKELLSHLDNSQTQGEAYQFLLDLKHYCANKQIKDSNFQFLKQNILDHNDQSISLDLLQFPSTFLPEAWSFTFYEGLIRYPATEYNNKKVIELGCGIGWISIALALRYATNYVCGLDINPKAIICARLNVHLNAFDDSGALKMLNNGKSLLDIVSFHESNLFAYYKDQDLIVDRIIGCIPQVLNPEAEVMETLIAETASDEYLHSLSNYFAKQGFIEDQFGLGLIASAVEQSIPLLEPNGKLILNLGGRPGRSVLERLMRRRGFKVRRVWQTQVKQAADTEIDTLVDIEKNTGHRFEFYMSANSDTPIDARTASKYAESGGEIFHSVDVYEAQMLFPQQVKAIYKSVDEIQGNGLRSAIDLTYDNHADAEERYSFLAFLAKHIQNTSYFPYEDTAGLNYFRQQLAEYFKYYYHVNISEQQIIINPGRKELIDCLLINYCPQLTLVAKSLHHLIAKDFDNDNCQILQVPSRIELLLKLVEKLRPQLIITRLDIHEIQSSQLVEQLLQCATQSNALLVIDLTDSIDLSSQPDIHGVYRYLSDKPLPGNLILMADLVNNRVYQNYSLNITLTSNKSITKHLVDAAELTYSRTPILKQYYYAHLLEQLLYFQRTRSTESSNSTASLINNQSSSLSLKPCKNAIEAFNHPAIEGNHLAFDKNSVRLDFGENELDTPDVLKQALFESYLVRKCTHEDYSPQHSLMALLSQRFNYPLNIYSKMIFGNGVAPIYAALLNICLRNKQTLVIPSGSYGYFVAAAQYKGLDICILDTKEDNSFKVSADDLRAILGKHKPCWLFLNAPVVNPTGAIYNQSELSELLNIAAEYGTTVIMDSIFSGLEFDANIKWDIADNIRSYSKHKKSNFILISGISKEYAAGGLRFAYACSTSQQLMNELEAEITHTPHLTIGYTIRKLIEAQLNQEATLKAHLLTQRKTLSERAALLGTILIDKGWQVITPAGGLFMVAKPQKFIDEHNLSDIEAGDIITKKLFQQQNLVINNSTWTGLPGYCRFVLSCSEESFKSALERLNKFDITDKLAVD